MGDRHLNFHENRDNLDAHIGQDSVERRGELTGSISDEEPELGEAITEIHEVTAGLTSIQRIGRPS